MEWSWIWKAIVIIMVGTVLLRIAGRKSISQMTLAQTIIMIAIGSVLVQPLNDRSLWVTIGVGAVFIFVLITMEWLGMKFNFFEKLITGEARIIIDNGVINEKNMRKLRFSVDLLEMQLRQNNVAKISDVQYATLEPNGAIGYILKENAQPATKAELKKLTQQMEQLKELVDERLPYVRLITEKKQSPSMINEELSEEQQTDQINVNNDLFAEVATKQHAFPPPKHLQ